MSRAIRNPTVLAIGFLFLCLVVFNAVSKVVATAASDDVLLHKLLHRTVHLEKIVLRTLSSLSFKLGQPFEEISLLFNDEIMAKTTFTLDDLEKDVLKRFNSCKELQLLNTTEGTASFYALLHHIASHYLLDYNFYYISKPW